MNTVLLDGKFRLRSKEKSHLVVKVNVSSMKLTWMEKTAGEKQNHRLKSLLTCTEWRPGLYFKCFTFSMTHKYLLFTKHNKIRLTDESNQQ